MESHPVHLGDVRATGITSEPRGSDERERALYNRRLPAWGLHNQTAIESAEDPRDRWERGGTSAPPSTRTQAGVGVRRPDTFARLPRLSDVGGVSVAVLGGPFNSGISYRPGARIGPGGIRASGGPTGLGRMLPPKRAPPSS